MTKQPASQGPTTTLPLVSANGTSPAGNTRALSRNDAAGRAPSGLTAATDEARSGCAPARRAARPAGDLGAQERTATGTNPMIMHQAGSPMTTFRPFFNPATVNQHWEHPPSAAS